MMPAYFEQILAPYSVEDFFRTCHEKDILYIKRNDASYYNDILTSGEISAYLEKQDIFYPSVRMVKNGKEIPAGEYTLKAVPIGHHKKDGIINTDKAFALFNAGATFVIQAGQRYFDHLSHCCLHLSKKFNAPVQANLYITPNKSQGFNPHWDTHDVFVLQIAGTKTWHLYGFEKQLPTKNQTFVSKDYKKEPLQTLQLMPGDFLYLPRGYVHDAIADDGISAHITMGILSFTWARFFNEVFPQLEEIKAFREAVPFWEENLEAAIQAKVAALKKTLDGLNYDAGIQRLNTSYRKAQPQPVQNYFQSLLDIEKTGPASRFSLNEGILFEIRENGEAGALQLFDKSIQIPGDTRPVIDFIFEKKHFLLNDLPGTASEEDKKVLLSKLVKEGIIYIDQL